MPVVLQPGEMPVRGGPGWAEITCAGPDGLTAGPDGLTVLLAEPAGA